MGKMKVKLTNAQKEKFQSMQSKQFDIVCYLDILEIYNNLESIDNVYAWALCTHDKTEDLIKEDGTFKKVHTHIVLILDKRVRASRLVRLFNSTEIRKIVTSKQLSGSYLYLTHESEKAIKEGKVKYEKSLLQVFNEDYFKDIDNYQISNTTLDIIDALISGVSYRELVARFGRDFVIYYQKYEFMARLIKQEELHNKINLTEINKNEN